MAKAAGHSLRALHKKTLEAHSFVRFRFVSNALEASQVGFYYLSLAGDLSSLNILRVLLWQTGVSRARDTHSLTASLVKLGQCEGHCASPPFSFSHEALLAPDVSCLSRCVESSQPWTGFYRLFSGPFMSPRLAPNTQAEGDPEPLIPLPWPPACQNYSHAWCMWYWGWDPEPHACQALPSPSHRNRNDSFLCLGIALLVSFSPREQTIWCR